MTFITYKVCFGVQKFYYDTCLGPKRAFGSKERLYASAGHQLDITWIPLLIQMSQFCLNSKQEGPWALNRSPEFLSQGVNINHKI